MALFRNFTSSTNPLNLQDDITVDKLLDMNDHYGFEYTSLIDDSIVPRENIELMINSNIIHFLIKLNVDLHSQDLEDQRVVLSVTCARYANQRVAKIYTSPNATKVLGITLDVPRNIHSEESLADFVTEVASSVDNQVLEAVMEKENKRKLFIMNLLKRLGSQVLCFDALEYYSASFLLEENNFVCLLDITIPLEFPNAPPRYRLLSTYIPNDPDDMVLPLPFNDNWDTSTMVDQALHVITTKCVKEVQEYTMLTFEIPK